MFIFNLAFTILIISYCDAVHPAHRVNSIGFRTSTDGVSPTGGTVILTVFYYFGIYQCRVNPTAVNQEYSCPQETITLIGIDCNSVAPQMLVDNSATPDGVVIDTIYFESIYPTLYSSSNFCYNQQLATGQWIDGFAKIGVCNNPGYDKYRVMCIDNEAAASGSHSCGPGKQLIKFESADAYIDDGTNVSIDLESNGCKQPCQDDSECANGMKCCPARHFCEPLDATPN
eukprot:356116_1